MLAPEMEGARFFLRPNMLNLLVLLLPDMTEGAWL
jgi:hypothetical protein